MKMNKYKIEKNETTQRKLYQDVKKFDVARFEYGDYDNWANAIILELNVVKNGKVLEIKWCTVNGTEYVAYDFINNGKAYLDIIGVATENIKKDEPCK